MAASSSQHAEDTEKLAAEAGPLTLRLDNDPGLVRARLSRSLPFFRDPFSAKENRLGGAEEKPTFLDLFFDLSMVAALTTFSSNHEAVEGAEVGAFVAFIVLLWWAWASKVIFDVRYARQDVVHRFATFLYVCLFAFLSAYSYGVNPGNLFRGVDFQYISQNGYAQIAALPDAADRAEATSELSYAEPGPSDINAWTSWSGVCVVFALSRLVLFMQYAIVVAKGGRRRLIPSLLLPMVGLAVSGWIVFGFHFDQAATDRENATRLGLVYGSIALDMLISLFVARLPCPVKHAHTELLLERLALLTLILLGEGAISLTRSLSAALNLFGFGSAAQWIQVFVALSLYFLVWLLIYDPLDPHAEMGSFKAHCYALMHLPFHVCLLLWLQTVVVSLLYYNWETGVNNITFFTSVVQDAMFGYFEPLLPGLPQTNISFNPPPETLVPLTRYLDLTQSSLAIFNYTLIQAAQGINQSTSMLSAGINVTDYIESAIVSFLVVQVGSNLATTAIQYGVSPTAEFFDIVNSQISTISYNFGDTSPKEENLEILLAAIFNAIVPASLFALPTAGGLLLMTALFSTLQRKPSDRVDWLLLSVRGACGLILCFLGFLSVGQHHVSGSDVDYIQDSDVPSEEIWPEPFPPAYRLLEWGWLLPVQTFVFAFVVIFDFFVLFWVKFAYKRHQRAEVAASASEKGSEGSSSG